MRVRWFQENDHESHVIIIAMLFEGADGAMVLPVSGRKRRAVGHGQAMAEGIHIIYIYPTAGDTYHTYVSPLAMGVG